MKKKDSNSLSGFPFVHGSQGRFLRMYMDRFINECIGRQFNPIFTNSVVDISNYEDLFREKKDFRVFKIGSSKRILAPEQTKLITKFYKKNPSLPRIWKVFSIGKCWRRDSPQKGRLREFQQLNLEIIKKNPSILDILNVLTILKKSLEGIDYRLEFSFTDGVISFLEKKIVSDSKDIPEILKLLDSLSSLEDIVHKIKIKDTQLFYRLFKERDFNLIQNYIKEKMKGDFLSALLKQKEVSFNPRIIRGLDYYDGFVFEGFLKESNKSIIGGGEYLIDSVRGIGFAIGMSRITSMIPYAPQEEKKIDIFLVGSPNEIARNTEILSKIEENPKFNLVLSSKIKSKNIEIDLGRQVFFDRKKERPLKEIVSFLNSFQRAPAGL